MFRQIWNFIVVHRWHLLATVPGFFLVTILHEGAHAAAVLVQNGTVLEFSVTPRTGELGHVRYVFAAGSHYSPTLIALAPYLLWLALAITAFALAFMHRTRGDAAGAWIFAWLFVVPLADIANAAFPYMAGERTDLFHVFGKPSAGLKLLVGAMTLAASIVGYFMQRRLYPNAKLDLAAYTFMTAGTLITLATFCFWITIRI